MSKYHRSEKMPRVRNPMLDGYVKLLIEQGYKEKEAYQEYLKLCTVKKDTNFKGKPLSIHGFANVFYYWRRNGVSKILLDEKINPRFIATEVQKFISSHPKFKFKLHNVSADVLNINTNDETYVITVKPKGVNNALSSINN